MNIIIVLCIVQLLLVAYSIEATTVFTRHAAHLQNVVAPPPIADFPWFNYNLSLADRAAALVKALTVQEKLSLMTNKQPAIPRLSIPYYDWESEASHGVARAGRATVFPSPIMTASSWNERLNYEAGRVVALEGRAKYNAYVKAHNGSNIRWYSLGMLAPNINAFTHPLFGRGQETLGEDVHLIASLSTQYVLGMQNWNHTDPKSLVQVSATCKHFFAYADSVYNGQVKVSDTDLLQTYFYAFRWCVQRGHARSVMCSYSTINGYQACAHPAMRTYLRDVLNFDGFLQSDAGAIGLIAGANNTVKSSIALLNGVDQDLDGGEYDGLTQALALGLIKESDLDVSLIRVFRERIRTGTFDPDALVPYSSLDLTSIDLPASRALARQAAREGTVLLKNEGLVPLDITSASLSKIAIIGPNANRTYTLLGNYDGCTDADGQNPPIDAGCVLITPLVGINRSVSEATARRARARLPPLQLSFDQGCEINSTDRSGFAAAISSAKAADVVVLVIGITTCSGGFGKVPIDCIEGEMLDRKNLNLPGVQSELVRSIISTGVPIILVVMSGSALALNEYYLAPNVLAIFSTLVLGRRGWKRLSRADLRSILAIRKIAHHLPF